MRPEGSMLHSKIMAYDLVVIGSGPGGYSAAVRAGQYGLKTAIIEKDPKLGGTCLHVGCVPTKALLHTAEVWDYFTHAAEQGLSCENPQLHLPAVMKRKQDIVDKHAKGITGLMRKNKVDVIAGFGTLKGGGRIDIQSAEGTRTIEAKAILIATGSEARMIPGLEPDDEFILTNVEILKLQAVPKTLAIIGAGAVGTEFASIFKRYGSQVTVLEMLPRLVPVEDEEVSKELERCFRKAGIRCETGAKASDVQRTGTGVALNVTLANGKVEPLLVDKLLIAVGRKPNTDKIGLENVPGVQLDRGFIKVGPDQQTGEPGVYAIGDIVAGTPQLAHVATAEGMILVNKLYANIAGNLDYENIPTAVFSQPSIGTVGLTETQAREKFDDIDVYKTDFKPMKNTLSGSTERIFMKMLVVRSTDKVVGMHMVGPEAGEIIQGFAVAIRAGATKAIFDSTIGIHPTAAEEFVTMRKPVS